MSGHGRSFMFASSSSHNHRTEEIRRSVQNSQVHSQNNTSHRWSTSSTVNQWHSGTNSKGNLVIAKKPEPSKSAEKKAEKKIWKILTDAFEDASRSLVSETVTDLMKVVKKFNRGEYDDTEQPSISKPPGPSSKTQIPRLQPPSAKSSEKVTPKKTNTVEPKNKSQRIPRELMQLVSSDGFVERPPIEEKRTPKRVSRFDVSKELNRSTRSNSSARGVQHKTIEKKIVRAIPVGYPSSLFSSNTQQRKPATATQTKPSSAPMVERVVKPTVKSSATGSASAASLAGRVSSQATMASTPRSAGNFMHNRVLITHYPMIEVKLESD